MMQTQTTQQKTISKRRSFSAWLRRKMSGGRGGVRKITPRVGVSPAETRSVFGVPLCESIQYARQTISYQDEDGTVYRQAGAIPTVVAKTGLFLKQNALQTEGIFRLSGSLKRVAALQETFDKPSFGADVDWEGITVHDAATLLRRYLNQLPDPVITHEYYQPFRDVMNDKSYNSIEERIDAFQALIEKLPLPHQQLLLYLLDMLNLFARNEQETRMDASNLAAVFCPAILSHPSHNTPVQYKISQRVIEFLIEFQALFTMQMVNKSTKSHDDVPPVPVLPDWVGATFIAEKKVPPLDMETVHRIRDDQPPLDSGTDVKTPAPFHIKDEDQSETPRRIPSPPARSLDSNHAYGRTQSLYNAYCKGNPVTLSVTIGVGLLLTLAVGYGGYRVMTLRNLINATVFFGGLSAFWTMLMQGVEAEKKPVDGGDFEDPTTETLMAQDRETEEAMMKDESLMAEWGDLMNRSWRNDPSTPSIMLMRRNSSSDYFGRRTPTLEENNNDDHIDQASMLSISSRFNEEQQNSSDDDYDDEDWSPDLAEEDLQKLWQQFEQMEKDKNLAEKLQKEEDAAERKRDEATNPFLVQSPISPKNTDQETWKIASRPQKQ